MSPQRDTMKAFRARTAAVERSVDEAVAAVKSARKAEWDAAWAAREVPPGFTAADLDGAVAVRTHHGWHRVVRVNAKSVTVATGHSWTDRIPLGRVLEFRKGGAS